MIQINFPPFSSNAVHLSVNLPVSKGVFRHAVPRIGGELPPNCNKNLIFAIYSTGKETKIPAVFVVESGQEKRSFWLPSLSGKDQAQISSKHP
jgi:hypothetical protein